jgi:hypothetical protein
MVAGRWIGAAMFAVGACSTDATSDATSAGDPATESSGGEAETGTGEPTDSAASAFTSGDEASSEGPEGESCPESHACIAPAPAGWRGPLALIPEGGDACPAAYPQLEVDAFTEVAGAPARCSCECDTSTLCGALIGSDLETACSFPSNILDTTAFTEPDVCTPIPTIDGEGFHLAFEPDLAGECSPSASVILPEPVPTDHMIACGGPVVAGGCPADLVCVYVDIDAQVIAPCIVRTGEHACPLEYPDVHPAFTSVLDERGCSACECTAPDGPASCNTTLRLSSADDCADQVVPDADVGAFTCVPAEGTMPTHLQFSAIEAYVTGCAPSGGLPVGTVEPAAPVTICCAG